MIKLYNPSNSDSQVMLDGTKYIVLAGETSRTITESISKRWRKLHGFLQEVPVDSEPEKIIKEIIETPEQDYSGLTRAELDIIAKEKGLNTLDYQNKAELIKALK